MDAKTQMTPEQSFFAVFCIESLADELGRSGNDIYRKLSDESDILDSYILPFFDILHTQGKGYIVRELMELMQMKGVLN